MKYPMKIKSKLRKFRRRFVEISVATLMIAYLIFMIFTIFYPSFYTPETQDMAGFDEKKKVAIIDQLSLYDNSTSFTDNMTVTLNSAGYHVDVYRDREITIGFYKNLPLLEHRLIIFRVHSAPSHVEFMPNATQSQPWWSVYLFTSELYSPFMHPIEQLSGQIVQAAITEASPRYFAIGPDFIRKSMRGEFNDPIIIMSSCKILNESDLADALIDRGVKGVISWNDLVELNHTDRAVEVLIENLIIEEMTVKEAVEATMEEVGPDPYYGSSLVFHPDGIGKVDLERLIFASNSQIMASERKGFI